MSVIQSAARAAGRWARRQARRLRHAPDRFFHRTRHRRVLGMLRSRPPRTILVMCLGNICRSPFAAAVIRERCNGRQLSVESAGFIGPDRPSPEAARRSARRHGIDLSEHRSRLVSPDQVRNADLIVVMDRTQRRTLQERFGRRSGVLMLGDLDPEPIDTRTVRDPYGHGEAVFDQVYQRIERCLDSLISSLQHP